MVEETASKTRARRKPVQMEEVAKPGRGVGAVFFQGVEICVSSLIKRFAPLGKI